MRKFACLLSCLVALSYGQIGVAASLKGGATLANQYGSDAHSKTVINGATADEFYANHPASNHTKAGFTAAAQLDVRWGRWVGVGLSAGFLPKGAKIDVSGPSSSYDKISGDVYWVQNYWFWEVPVKIFMPVLTEAYVLAGPSFAYLLKSQEQGKIKIDGQKHTYTRDRGANDRESGFILGAGYHFTPNLGAEFAWNRALFESYGADMVPNPQYYYNQTFSLNVVATLNILP